jgi:lysophospholipase L1-like esterase
MPQYPIHVVPHEPDPPDPQSFVNSVRNLPGVIVLDEHLFDNLEHPDYFFDGLHLNSTGRAKFSEAFAEALKSALSRQN